MVANICDYFMLKMLCPRPCVASQRREVNLEWPLKHCPEGELTHCGSGQDPSTMGSRLISENDYLQILGTIYAYYQHAEK